MTPLTAHLTYLAEDLALVAEVLPTLTRLAEVLRVDPRTIRRTLARGHMSGYMARRWLGPGHHLRGLAAGCRRGVQEREARRQIELQEMRLP